MRPFTFALMLLAQRVDEALQLERLRPRPSLLVMTRLHRRKHWLRSRLRRALSRPIPAAS